MQSTTSPTIRPRGLILDRDGTLLEHVEPYILHLSEIIFRNGADTLFRTLSQLGIPFAVVSNQSPIARGLASQEFVHSVNRLIDQRALLHGCRALSYQICPHLPTDGCACRKPRPKLLRAAARSMGLSPVDCWMVGDQSTDLEAGHRAGCARSVLVRSGRPSDLVPAEPAVDDLLQLSDVLLSTTPSNSAARSDS
jgi:histidinol-phosphate phosphatase family protein